MLLFSGKRQGPCSSTISVTFRTELPAITSFAVDLGCREKSLVSIDVNKYVTDREQSFFANLVPKDEALGTRMVLRAQKQLTCVLFFNSA